MRRSDDIPTVPALPGFSDPALLATLPTPHAIAAAEPSAASVALADVAVDGPQARAAGGLTGAGIKIGILSDSYNVLGGAAGDISAGLLPAAGVNVLEEGPAGSSDEGRAMAELVHATAPGAQLYFYSAFYSETDFAAGIAALRAAGCQIILDDITYPDESMFQIAGPIDLAVQQAVSSGADYFSAVGNEGSSFYQATFTPIVANIPGLGVVTAQRFSGDASTVNVEIPAGFAVTLALDWDAAYTAVSADSLTAYALRGASVVASSLQAGSAAVITLEFPVLGVARDYTVAVVQNAGTPAPGLFKMVLEGGGTIEDAAAGQGSGSAIGHSLVPGVNAVGAVDVSNTPAKGGTPTPESYSSTGPGQLRYASNGSRLATPVVPGVPDFLAPDGASTGPIDPFFGTSAAAPVAAAVAALMLQAVPTLSTGDVTTLLEDSAIPAGAPSVAGAGLIQADRAVNYAETGLIAGSAQTVIRGTSRPVTIQTGAAGHWVVAGSGATSIQAQGADTVQVGSGSDTVDLTGATAQLYGGTGATWVRTLGGQDTIVGSSGALTVSGGAGGGVIYGGTGGNNVLTAGTQTTIILSEGTGDVVTGVGDGDLLYASNLGGDVVIGGSGAEVLVGGTGGSNFFRAGPGDPLLALEASSGVLSFGTGDATVLDGTSAETMQFTNGLVGGFDVIYGFDPQKDLVEMAGWSSQQTEVEQSVAGQFDTGGNAWIKFPDGTVVAFVGLAHLDATSLSFT